MKPVVAPHGKAQVGYVEATLVAGDGNDVAILDGLAQQFCVSDGRLGNVAVGLSRQGFFLLADDGHKFRMGLQGLIGLRMFTHIADGNLLDSRKGRIRLLHLADKAHQLFVDNPVGEIVQPRGIFVEFALTVTQTAEHGQIVVPRSFVVLDAQLQCRHRFDKRGTIKLAGVDHQLFLVVDFQGVSHIGNAHKLSGYPQRRSLTVGLAQQLAYLRAVGALTGHLSHRGRSQKRHQADSRQPFHHHVPYIDSLTHNLSTLNSQLYLYPFRGPKLNPT